MKILEAKNNAEKYLNKAIKEKWGDVFGGTTLPSDYSDAWDFPIRLEAYCYLGRKYKKKHEIFSREIFDLWKEWLDLSKKGIFGSELLSFWPSKYSVIDISFNKQQHYEFSANEIECHVSMFRTKEIFGKGVFDEYFRRATKRIKGVLFKQPDILISGDDLRFLWQIVRSPALASELRDELKVIAKKLAEDEKLQFIDRINTLDKDKNEIDPHFVIPVLFFLSACNFNDDFRGITKKAAERLIAIQMRNGSFFNDPLLTCLGAATIKMNNADPSNIALSIAAEFILKKQLKQGCWDFIGGWDFLMDYKWKAWAILSTVIALETIDLLYNQRPMPIWATIKKSIYSKDTDNRRIQDVIPLDLPVGTMWSDITLIFSAKLEEEKVVDIRIRKKRYGHKKYYQLGFEDKRTGNPDSIWETLKLFAKRDGIIAWENPDLKQKDRYLLKAQIKDLRKRLINYFRIYEDPLHPYRETKSYKVKYKTIYLHNSSE